MKKFTTVVQQSKWTTKDILERALFESKKITSEADFKAWAKTVLQKAFGSDFDEEKYNDVVNGLLDKYGDNYGAMVGALSYGLSEGKNEKIGTFKYVYKVNVDWFNRFKAFAKNQFDIVKDKGIYLIYYGTKPTIHFLTYNSKNGKIFTDIKNANDLEYLMSSINNPSDILKLVKEGKDDKMARYDRFFQMAEKVYDEVPYDKLTNRKLIQSALKKHGYPTDPLTVGEVLRLIQREIINDSKAPFSSAMIDDTDDLETLIQMADDLGIKNVQNLPKGRLKKLIRDAYNKNFVNEAKIEGREEYNGIKYEIHHKAPSGYYVYCPDLKLPKTYFDTYDEAKEHAELEIDGFLDESVNEAKIESDADFKEYAETVLKKAFGDKYNDDTAQKMITDLIDKYDGDYGAMVGALTSGLGESLNEAARVGKSDWFAVLKDLKREGWDINYDVASMYYANDDEEEREIQLSNYNDDVIWTIYDGKRKQLNSGSFDAEGLSAGELNIEVWDYVDESLNEALHDDWSIGHEYGVFRTGGSIGEKHGVVANLGGEVGILVSTFNDEKDANEYAKRMKKYLSPGERKYYGMSYKVKKLDSRIKEQMTKLMV